MLNDGKVPYNCAPTAQAMVRCVLACADSGVLTLLPQQRKAFDVQDGKDSLKFECKVHRRVHFREFHRAIPQALPKLAELLAPCVSLDPAQRPTARVLLQRIERVRSLHEFASVHCDAARCEGPWFCASERRTPAWLASFDSLRFSRVLSGQS